MDLSLQKLLFRIPNCDAMDNDADMDHTDDADGDIISMCLPCFADDTIKELKCPFVSTKIGPKCNNFYSIEHEISIAHKTKNA